MSTPSLDSVGRAIKAVEMEGWSSDGVSDPGHHISSKFPGTPTFVANSIPNGFVSTPVSYVPTLNFSISVLLILPPLRTSLFKLTIKILWKCMRLDLWKMGLCVEQGG